MDLASVFRQSLELWQNPSETEMPAETFVNCANRCITQRFLELDLTLDAIFSTVTSDIFQFDGANAREKNLDGIIDDISRIVRVESRVAGSGSTEDHWREETRTSFDNWQEMLERGDEAYIAFHGNQADGLTMVAGTDVSTLEFRIVYRQLRSKINTLTELVDLPSVYEPVLVYDIALEMGELMDNQSESFLVKKSTKMPYLLQRLTDAVNRVDKWRRSQRGLKRTHRRAFNNRSGGVDIRRRRFTVNF